MSDDTITAGDHIEKLLAIQDHQKGVIDEANRLTQRAQVLGHEFKTKLTGMVVRDELRPNVVYMHNGKGYMVVEAKKRPEMRMPYERESPVYTLECYEIGK